MAQDSYRLFHIAENQLTTAIDFSNILDPDVTALVTSYTINPTDYYKPDYTTFLIGIGAISSCLLAYHFFLYGE